MSNLYPTNSQLDSHVWRLDIDRKRNFIYQACSCGWKIKVRDFNRPAGEYDSAYEWMNHFDFNSGS
jgi:hypothetical protein